MSSTPSPYLSIVVVGRNDDYGGDFNERLQNAITWLSYWVEKCELPTEFFLVDYNPIEENEPLRTKIKWPENRRFLQIRMMTVPREVHQSLVNPDIRFTVPVFEFPAKNMAIRRARGEVILSTNADILPDPGILRFIKNKSTSKSAFYRADRYDYHRISNYDFSNPRQLISTIKKNIFVVHLRGYAFEFSNGLSQWELLKFKFKNGYQRFKDINVVKFESLAMRYNWKIVYDNIPQKFHTHCSGDFMLMHKDHWQKLRGYPEETLISTHVDALFTVMAGTSGLKEKIVKWPLYHQDHERRYITNVGRDDADNRIQVMYDRLTKEGKRMVAMNEPIIYNDKNWGFGNMQFEEEVF
jgi:hypothetical protein